MNEYGKEYWIRTGYALVDQQLVHGAWIHVRKDSIEAIKAEKPNEVASTVVDWGDKLVVPGTVNAHNHSFQSLLRGIGDDESFLTWRDKALYAVGPKLSPEGVALGAKLAFGEMLLHGVTTVCDFFYLNHQGNDHAQAVIEAGLALGMRTVMARCFYDWDGAPPSFRETPKQAAAHFDELATLYRDHPQVSLQPAPHSLHGASREMLEAGRDAARRHKVPWHIHLAEEHYQIEECLTQTGKRPLHYLHDEGLLDENMIAVHGCWFDESERTLLAQHARGLAYNPASNMFLGDGITDLVDLDARGITVGLGTDGGCSNSRVSVFDEMRSAGLLQKVAKLNGQMMPAEKTFAMGTRHGADLLGLAAGRLAAGHLADLVAIDLSDLSLWPPSRVLKNLVYSMSARAITHVVVGGKLVVENGELLQLDRESLREDISALFDLLQLPLWAA